jgi:formylglycine-generating enzyme required for sulfatase activity
VVHRRKKHHVRNFFVAFFAIILTTLAVNATDHISNFRGSLLGSAIDGVLPEHALCEKGMVQVSSPKGDFCIDKYEASTGTGCQFKEPKNITETHENIVNGGCTPVSEPGRVPWTNISQNQAVEVCAKVGKHLASNEEWFLASLGTPDQSERWGVRDCNVSRNWISGEVGVGGSGERCVSSVGAFDMIGNVWEWTYETVDHGVYGNSKLPESGFVQAVSSEGIPTETNDDPNPLYYLDRFWVNASSTTGIFRGGYWGSLSDAGRYAVHSEIPPSFSGAAVGFRCAK